MVLQYMTNDLHVHVNNSLYKTGSCTLNFNRISIFLINNLVIKIIIISYKLIIISYMFI